eukprot:NODE_14_length_51535_cov_1.125049.p13 type:complete len:390 gc:universal NODE_14_length_51535_cov_1.125049:5563-4394(-)
MQCFTKRIVEDLILRELYKNEYINKQLFKSLSVVVWVSFTSEEYRITINNDFVFANTYFPYKDKLIFLPVVDDKVIGIIDLKSGTIKYVAVQESIADVHILEEHLIVVTKLNILKGPATLINLTGNINDQMHILAPITGVSCVYKNFICVGSAQGVSLFTVLGKSHLIPLVGEKSSMICSGNFLYTSGKIGYVYDLKNRYNAYSGPLSGKWICNYILNTQYLVSDNCIELVEKDIYSKVQQAIKKEMFELGILLIEEEPDSSFATFEVSQSVYDIHQKEDLANLRLFDKKELCAEVYKLFANNTYLHDDKDKAMQYFIETIGYLEPSVVILKYVNAQRMEQLMDYLEMLHTRKVATPDHTTLLLNCYSKINGISRLETFLKVLFIDVEF